MPTFTFPAGSPPTSGVSPSRVAAANPTSSSKMGATNKSTPKGQPTYSMTTPHGDFIVPPFNVDHAIIAQATKALSVSFDATVNSIATAPSCSSSPAAAALLAEGGASPTKAAKKTAGTPVTSTTTAATAHDLTHQHIAKIFKDASTMDSYGNMTLGSHNYNKLMAILKKEQQLQQQQHSSQNNDTTSSTPVVSTAAATTTTAAASKTAPTASAEEITSKFEFLMPFAWQTMRKTMELAKNAGRSLEEMRQEVEATKSFWRNNAYKQISNDLLPFITRGSKILVLGEGRLVSFVLKTVLQHRMTANMYVLEGRPEMPHEELKSMLAEVEDVAGPDANAGAASFIGNPPAGGKAFSSPNTNSSATASSPSGPSCCGQRLIDDACKLPTGEDSADYRSRMRLIPDSSAASVLRGCNFVLLGAYAATKNGGVVHRAGSLQLAMLAKAMDIPVYVLCESYKFTPMYPLESDNIAQPRIPDGWREAIMREKASQHAAASASAAVAPLPSSSSAPAVTLVSSSPTAAVASTNAAPLVVGHVGYSDAKCASGGANTAPGSGAKNGSVGGDSNNVTNSFYHGHYALEHVGARASATVAANLAEEGTASTGTAAPLLPTPHYLEFVPGDLITLFFTDRRILPPSGVVVDIHQAFPSLE